MFTLDVRKGRRKGRIAVEGGPITIGRSSQNIIALPDAQVSREHCVIDIVDGVVEVRDLGSSNGTHVNGVLIDVATLESGDRVGVGPYEISFTSADLLEAEADAPTHDVSLASELMPESPSEGTNGQVARTDLLTGDTDTDPQMQVTEELRALHRERALLEQQREEAAAAIARTEARRAELQARTDRLSEQSERLDAEHDRIAEAETRLENDRAQWQVECRETREAWDRECSARAGELDEQKLEIEALREAVEQERACAAETTLRLAAESEEIAGLRSEADDRLTLVLEESDQVAMERRTLEADRQRWADEHAAAVKSWQEQVESLDRTAADLEQERLSLEASRSDALKHEQALEQRAAGQARVRDRLRKEQSEWEQARASTEQALDRRAARLDELAQGLDGELATARRERDEACSRVNELLAEVTRMRQLDSTHSDEVEQERDALKARLQKLESGTAVVSREAQILVKQLRAREYLHQWAVARAVWRKMRFDALRAEHHEARATIKVIEDTARQLLSASLRLAEIQLRIHIVDQGEEPGLERVDLETLHREREEHTANLQTMVEELARGVLKGSTAE